MRSWVGLVSIPSIVFNFKLFALPATTLISMYIPCLLFALQSYSTFAHYFFYFIISTDFVNRQTNISERDSQSLYFQSTPISFATSNLNLSKAPLASGTSTLFVPLLLAEVRSSMLKVLHFFCFVICYAHSICKRTKDTLGVFT